MHSKLHYLVLVFACVGAFKTTSDSSSSAEENYSLLITNQSYDVPTNDFSSNQIEHQRKSLMSPEESNMRSEALIKKIHPFIYPKQFNTLEGMPTRGFNATNEHPNHLVEIRDLENPNHERDDSYGTSDQNHPNGDLIPLGTHLFDRPAGLTKHDHFHYGYFDKQQYHPMHSNTNNCLGGLLQGCDPLVLMGILGFLAYVINTILRLVDRINLPLLSPHLTSDMTAASAATNAAATKTSLIQQHQNLVDNRGGVESNQKLLKDFERILQMAIEMYEHKMNTM